MTRKTQLQALVVLAATSAALQYVVQGALASGGDPGSFPPFFWVTDYALWAIRALIESAVIVYLFQTETDDPVQRRVLAGFEIALIALITLTIGPALRALGLGQAMKDSIPPAAFWAWNFGLAAYTSLMMGGAGYAYKVQPGGAGLSETLEQKAAHIRASTDVKAERARMALELRTNGHAGLTDRRLAELVGVSESTVRNAKGAGNDQD